MLLVFRITGLGFSSVPYPSTGSRHGGGGRNPDAVGEMVLPGSVKTWPVEIVIQESKTTEAKVSGLTVARSTIIYSLMKVQQGYDVACNDSD